MRTVIVGGVHKGAGKTTVACALAGALPGWGALKVTTTHEGTICPVNAACTACGELQGTHEVVLRPEVIERPGSDTWRLAREGAAAVVWLRATPEHLREGLQEALDGLQGLPGVVVEGTNAARHLPGLYLLVARPPVRRIKPSARATAARADLTVLNLPPGWLGGGLALLRAELPGFEPGRPTPYRGLQPDAPESTALIERVRGLVRAGNRGVPAACE